MHLSASKIISHLSIFQGLTRIVDQAALVTVQLEVLLKLDLTLQAQVLNLFTQDPPEAHLTPPKLHVLSQEVQALRAKPAHLIKAHQEAHKQIEVGLAHPQVTGAQVDLHKQGIEAVLGLLNLLLVNQALLKLIEVHQEVPSQIEVDQVLLK